MVIILIVAMISQVYVYDEYIKTHQIIHFKCVKSFLCQL